MAQLKPKLIVLDTAADLFGGSEINRGHTRSFIAQMRRLALAAGNDAGVLMLTHPSLEGIRSGSGLSGSTAWHNSVRARCVLKKFEVDEDDEEPDNDMRVLEWRKNNYGPAQETIPLCWQNGVYVRPSSTSTLAQQLRERNCEAVFLDVLRKLLGQQRTFSDKPGPNYAPTMFAGEAEAKTVKPRITARELTAAMRRLFDQKRIAVKVDGPQSRQRRTIVEA